MSLLIPSLAFLGALVVLLAEYRFGPNPKLPRERRRRQLVLLGSLIVIGTAFFSAWDSGKQQGRIETLATETRALVTGGNSFVWLSVVPMFIQEENFAVLLNHGGDAAPSFDIDIQFQTTGQCDGFPERTMGNILASGLSNPQNMYIPALSSESVRILPTTLNPTCDDAYYLVLVQSRNRSTIQQILLNRTAEKTWLVALRVVDINTDEVLKELPAPGSNNNVDWPDDVEFRNTYRQMLNVLGHEQNQHQTIQSQ